jgi:hypothetical protein
MAASTTAARWGRRYVPWFYNQVRTLEEAFGVQRPTGWHLKKWAEHERLRPHVVLSILEAQRTHRLTAIDPEAFEIVGRQKHSGVTQSLAKTIWYEEESKFWRDLFECERKSGSS